MSKFETGGIISHDESRRYWMHPDADYDRVLPDQKEQDMLREEIILLRKILSESNEIRIMPMLLKGDDRNDRA